MLSGFSWKETLPRSPLLLRDSVQTQVFRLTAHKREAQIMLHHMKTPTVVLVTFPRQEQEQSLPEVARNRKKTVKRPWKANVK